MTTGPEERQLPVLDMEQGIARLLGNRRVYFNALRRFAGYADAPRSLMAQLEAGDYPGACRMAHTLKGAAGLLCAGEVQAIATRLEAALASRRVERPLLDELQSALERLQACIAATAASEAAKPAMRVPPPATGDARELLDRFDALLDEGNGNAVDHADRYGPVLEETLGAAAWQAVAAAVADYDFERALAALRSSRPAAMR